MDPQCKSSSITHFKNILFTVSQKSLYNAVYFVLPIIAFDFDSVEDIYEFLPSDDLRIPEIISYKISDRTEAEAVWILQFLVWCLKQNISSDRFTIFSESLLLILQKRPKLLNHCPELFRNTIIPMLEKRKGDEDFEVLSKISVISYSFPKDSTKTKQINLDLQLPVLLEEISLYAHIINILNGISDAINSIAYIGDFQNVKQEDV